MNAKKLTLIAFIIASVLGLTAMPFMAGCGDDGDKEKTTPTSATTPTKVREIVIGAFVDLSGPTVAAQKPMYQGFRDYYRYVEEENPIPGIKLKLVVFDEKYDPSRFPEGYMWLVGQGALAMHSISAGSTEALQTRFEGDHIPFMSTKTTSKLVASPYYFSTAGLPEAEQEALTRYIMETWDYAGSGRSPKIGFVGMAKVPWSIDPQKALQQICEANPDKLDWVGAEMPPPGTMTWAAEVGRLMDCDYIVPQISGPGGPAFVREAMTRGYNGKFIGSAEAFVGFWTLYEALPKEWLDGLLVTTSKPTWDEQTPWVIECKKYTEKYLSGQDLELAMKQHITRMDGWAVGMVMAEAIRHAAASLGPDKVDGIAIRDEIEKTNITDPAFGGPLKFGSDVHSLFNTSRIDQYDTTQGKWVTVSDWYTASFAEHIYE